jgi:hypothetical protein
MSFGYYSDAFLSQIPLLKLHNPQCAETNKSQNIKFECDFAPFDGIILVECLMDFFENELKKVEQFLKAFKKSSPKFNKVHFSRMYSFKKELTKNFIQINDQNLKDGLYVSIKI